MKRVVELQKNKFIFKEHVPASSASINMVIFSSIFAINLIVAVTPSSPPLKKEEEEEEKNIKSTTPPSAKKK